MELLKIATKPILDFINQNPSQIWRTAVNMLDKDSVEHFLRHNPVGPSLSPGALDMMKLLLALEGFPEHSFLSIYENSFIFLIKT
ncbi:hypothetical protein [Peribacillus glennii]|uniref:hypothetical protein n=1 Tax=Peribacillus glennii TaxID=2303991 RepID=UPI001F2842C8|nr:hypothetical protein [Peribacillus glennii]